MEDDSLKDQTYLQLVAGKNQKITHLNPVPDNKMKERYNPHQTYSPEDYGHKKMVDQEEYDYHQKGLSMNDLHS